MLEQAACDLVLSGLHHVLPHLERSPLLIEECESLLPAYRTPLLISQSYQVRKCDFGDHAFSVFLLGHCLDPTGLSRFKGCLTLLWETRFRELLEASAVRRHGMPLIAVGRLCDAQATNLVLQRRTLQSQTFGGSPLAC